MTLQVLSLAAASSTPARCRCRPSALHLLLGRFRRRRRNRDRHHRDGADQQNFRNGFHVESPSVERPARITRLFAPHNIDLAVPTVDRRLRAALRSALETAMKRSTERFLTTHTGSLPRPDDLIRMMYAKEEGVPVDRDALAAAGALGRRRGGQEAGRCRRRSDQRRRIVEAELRHLHQGPAQRLRRHRQHVRLPGSRRLPEARAAGVRRSRPLAAQDAGLQRPDQRARCRRRRGPTPTISRRRCRR